jgi:phage baseplate assembly protein W
MALQRVSKGFRDVSFTFKRNPLTNDIISIKNETAIARSVRNIVYTIPGEMPFNPQFGTNISRSLFENMDNISAMTLKDQITFSVTRFEPRVNLLSVKVDPIFDNNEYNVTIIYEIIGIDVPAQSLSFVLQSNR